MGKIKQIGNDIEKKCLVVAQDMKLVRALAGNDKKVRDRALKKLKKWLEERNSKMPYTEEDFMRIWKGLYYTMWMSDKPLIQEECAENIAKLLHFSTPETSLLFFKCGLTLLATEWFGIDQWRLNKFLMLIRRILRQIFEVLKEQEWKSQLVTEFGNILLETILTKDTSTHLGCTMHITEIYLEELAKVSNGKIEADLMLEFLRPFIKYMSTLTDNSQINHIQKFMFHHLIRQSDVGIESENRFEAWKERGFPKGTINCMEKVQDDEEVGTEEEMEEKSDSEEKPLDPRAGHVDVILPQLKFDALEVSKLFHEYKFTSESTTMARKAMTALEHQFEKLSKGIYPFGFRKIRMPALNGDSTKLRKSVNRLVKFEKKILHDSIQNRNRKRKNTETPTSRNAKEPKLDSVDFFRNQLENFMAKSEGKLTNRRIINKKLNKNKGKVFKSKLKVKSDDTNWAYEDYFRRNSGTWFVHRFGSLENENKTSEPITDKSPVENNLSTEAKIVPSSPKNTHTSPKKKSLESNETNKNDTVRISPKTRRKSEPLFAPNEWDEPPKTGEVEIFVPSNKFKNKMKMRAKEEGKNLNNVLNASIKKLVKQRYSLDAKLVKNPFAKNGITPKSEKRVKINLKLNKSQEIHEHQVQIKSSPAIPYDANKQPVKPLLKVTAVKSPINPFYKRKLKL